MPDRTRRPSVGSAPAAPEVATPASTVDPALAEALAPGGGNSVAMGYMGSMDAGEREIAGGGTAYGRASDGWLDSIGAGFDRMLAMAELQDRFTVVEDDFVGPRLPNQVTRSEMERIATMYSDIRRGTTNVQFDSAGMTPDEYEAFQRAAMGDIATILTTEQGRDLMDQLAYGQVDGRDETVTLGRAANPAAAGMDMAPGENAADIFNGTGVSTVINYAAGQDFDMATLDRNYESAPYRNTTSDLVLYHELLHALHYRMGSVQGDMVNGSPDFVTVGRDEATIRNDRGVNLEEYETVGLGETAGDLNENAYRAERSLVTGTAIPQRGDYSGAGPSRRRRR